MKCSHRDCDEDAQYFLDDSERYEILYVCSIIKHTGWKALDDANL